MTNCEPCFLCDHNATTPDGVIYYRFYDPVAERWASEAICPICFAKLKGPMVPFKVNMQADG